MPPTPPTPEQFARVWRSLLGMNRYLRRLADRLDRRGYTRSHVYVRDLHAAQAAMHSLAIGTMYASVGQGAGPGGTVRVVARPDGEWMRGSGEGI